MDTSNKLFTDVMVLGGGPAGLAAAHVLTAAGMRLIVIEGNACVGGLARTIEHHGFRFDLGGHRFLTSNARLEELVRDLLQDELLVVERASKILFRGRYFAYPLDLRDVLSGVGFRASLHIIADYLLEQFKQRFRRSDPVSLEDWVIRRFGRTLFRSFFRDYSEKVWGIGCDRIAAEWADSRIQGLSLLRAVRDAFVRSSDHRTRTLARSFLYPSAGFGRICECLKTGIETVNAVVTGSRIVGIHHADGHIEQITVQHGDDIRIYGADEYLCSIPVTTAVRLLDPPAPAAVLDAASRLDYRDMVIVTLMIDRERVTDQTWIYFPETSVPFSRIHEPKNWSKTMAPAGKTHLVVEYFCFDSDPVWAQTDEQISGSTIAHLQQLGLIDPGDIIDRVVMRIPKAYPVLEVGYRDQLDRISDYLDGFDNLHLIGRSGEFRYYNTDHAMESGMAAAESIIARNRDAAAPGADPSMSAAGASS